LENTNKVMQDLGIETGMRPLKEEPTEEREELAEQEEQEAKTQRQILREKKAAENGNGSGEVSVPTVDENDPYAEHWYPLEEGRTFRAAKNKLDAKDLISYVGKLLLESGDWDSEHTSPEILQFAGVDDLQDHIGKGLKIKDGERVSKGARSIGGMLKAKGGTRTDDGFTLIKIEGAEPDKELNIKGEEIRYRFVHDDHLPAKLKAKLTAEENVKREREKWARDSYENSTGNKFPSGDARLTEEQELELKAMKGDCCSLRVLLLEAVRLQEASKELLRKQMKNRSLLETRVDILEERLLRALGALEDDDE
jgi:hypothetical protein